MSVILGLWNVSCLIRIICCSVKSYATRVENAIQIKQSQIIVGKLVNINKLNRQNSAAMQINGV